MLSDMAILLCNLVTRCWAFFQLLENFFLRAIRRCKLSQPRQELFQRLQPTKRCIELRSPRQWPRIAKCYWKNVLLVAVLLRRILWRRAPRWNQKLHRAAGHTAIVVAYPGLKVPGLRHSLGSDGGRDL